MNVYLDAYCGTILMKYKYYLPSARPCSQAPAKMKTEMVQNKAPIDTCSRAAGGPPQHTQEDPGTVPLPVRLNSTALESGTLTLIVPSSATTTYSPTVTLSSLTGFPLSSS